MSRIAQPQAATAPPAIQDQRTAPALPDGLSPKVVAAVETLRRNCVGAPEAAAEINHIMADAIIETGDVAGVLGQAIPLMASARKTPAEPQLPRVVIEQLDFPGNAIVFYRNCGNGRHRIAWNPAKATRAEVEMFINIYVAASGEYVEVTPEQDRQTPAATAQAVPAPSAPCGAYRGHNIACASDQLDHDGGIHHAEAVTITVTDGQYPMAATLSVQLAETDAEPGLPMVREVWADINGETLQMRTQADVERVRASIYAYGDALGACGEQLAALADQLDGGNAAQVGVTR